VHHLIKAKTTKSTHQPTIPLQFLHSRLAKQESKAITPLCHDSKVWRDPYPSSLFAAVCSFWRPLLFRG